MRFSLRCMLALILVGCNLAAGPAPGQTILGFIGSGPGGSDGQLALPVGVAIDTANGGNVLVLDQTNNQIDVFSADGRFLRTIGSYGMGDGQLFAPDALAIDTANGSNIVVADLGNNRFEVFDSTGNFVRTIGSFAVSGTPTGVAIDLANNSNVVTINPKGVVVFDKDGNFIRSFGSAGDGDGQFGFADGVAIDLVNDSNVLVADQATNRVEVFTATGTFIRTIGGPGSGDGQLNNAQGVAVDTANGSNVLVADQDNGRIEVFSATGNFIRSIPTVNNIASPPQSQSSEPTGIAIDLANNSNVLVTATSQIGVYTDAFSPTPLAAAILPGGRSVEISNVATVFATMLNTSADPLSGCQIGILAPEITAGYQTTDPATNALTGAPNTPVTIPAMGSQTFVLNFTAAAPEMISGWPLIFGCDGVAPATPITGVNAIDLTFSATPIADIIVEAAVASGNGILTVPYSQGQAAAFAVATSNAGATGQLFAEVDTGSATLPLTLNLCQTNPDTGQCLPPYAPSVQITIPAGATPTFSVFVSATGAVPFDPANSRVFVRFVDSDNNSHGSTSVAVETD